MENSNCSGRNSKTTQSGNVPCPWISRYPILQQVYLGDGQQYFRPKCNSFGEENTNCSHGHVINNYQTGLHQQSSNHFFQFLRLTQLFPEIHPATLHTVSVLCKHDFFSTVDKLVYAKRCKQLNTVKNLPEQTTPKTNRYQPYYVAKPVGKVDVNFSEDSVENGKSGGKQEKIDGGKVEKSPSDVFIFASPKCKLPIRPLSPIVNNNPEDLSPSVSQS